jgi:hypothetical protein
VLAPNERCQGGIEGVLMAKGYWIGIYRSVVLDGGAERDIRIVEGV